MATTRRPVVPPIDTLPDGLDFLWQCSLPLPSDAEMTFQKQKRSSAFWRPPDPPEAPEKDMQLVHSYYTPQAYIELQGRVTVS